jgi:hypothetical protein
LAYPTKDEPLLLYIAATTQVVSTALVVKRQEEGHVQKIQRLVYSISEVLADSKLHYPHVQKMIYAVSITSCKLVHYFQGHECSMVTEFPLESILHGPDITGHIAKWGIELELCILKSFRGRLIKSQVLADFITEWTETQLPPVPEPVDT